MSTEVTATKSAGRRRVARYSPERLADRAQMTNTLAHLYRALDDSDLNTATAQLAPASEASKSVEEAVAQLGGSGKHHGVIHHVGTPEIGFSDIDTAHVQASILRIPPEIDPAGVSAKRLACEAIRLGGQRRLTKPSLNTPGH